MKNVKILILASIIAGFILSCGLLDERYDPLEAGDYIFLIDNFYLDSSSHGDLYWDAWGEVNNNDYTIDVPVPPSLDMETESLSAWISIYNAGTASDEDSSYNYYNVYETDVWGYSNNYLVSYYDYDSSWTGTALFEIDYSLSFNPTLECYVFLENSDRYYYSEPEIPVYVQFNDNVDPDLDSGPYTTEDFIDGLFGTNCSFSSLTSSSFSPTLSDEASLYYFDITAIDEGSVSMSYESNSVMDETGLVSNEASSNEIEAIYDITAPTPPDSDLYPFEVTTNSTTPTDLEYYFLQFSFSEGTDYYIYQSNIQYMIVFSEVESNLTTLSAMETSINNTTWEFETWNYYNGEIYRTYSAFDSNLTNLFPTTSGEEITIYFNLLLADSAYPGNSSYWYGDGNISLYTTEPVAVTFTIP